MGMFDKFLKAGEGRKLKALADLVPDINALEPEIQGLSDVDLQHKTVEFRERLDNGESLDHLLIEAFAVTREAASRVIGQRHYDVQLMGGAALHFGWVAEMRTGEGKTLVSTLPVYLNGLTGDGVHLITVNDYLAKRDMEWMGRVHRFLGLSVGLILPDEWDWDHKRAQYACDITYGTNNEFGFDYLRDNMAASREEQVQRGHSYAIVDEVDSILIDEARTPLIISGQVDESAKLYYRFASIVRALKRDEDYDVDEEKRTVAPTDRGVEKVEKALGVENMYDAVSQNLVHQLTVALKAKELYHRDKDYLVADGEVKIVDEFTGRILEGRRWSEGLHQAVEAKEGVRIKEENQTLATITLQNYFRMYDKLAGMTGTAQTEAAELMNTYKVQVVTIPTHRPTVRADEGDQIYKNELAKFNAVVEDIVSKVETGQPVLVGTASVERSEILSRMLAKRGVSHEVLNAKQHTREAEIVTQAGQLGKVTVATNMAGRGVDILLGGNPEGLARQEVRAEGLDEDSEEGKARYDELLPGYVERCKEEGQKIRDLGGLYVLGTERHESRRIDNQLRGRSGRQGDPGSSRFYLSLEDELMRLFATGAIQAVMGKGWPDDQPIEARMVTKAIERAQNTVEQRNAEIRKNVLQYDEVMNEQRKVIYARRDQVLDGVDLSEQVEESLAESINRVIGTYAPTELSEDWDVEQMHTEFCTYFPLQATPEELRATAKTDALYELVMGQAMDHYHERTEKFGAEAMREIERQIMLQMIDVRWREHLREMDHLQDGIGLRAMGQKDPLVEWQREGFEMFGQLMEGIDDEFVKYVLHVDAVIEDEPTPDAEALSYSAPDDPSVAGSTLATMSGDGEAAPAPVVDAPAQAPVVKSDLDKTPRNAPCPCGSGKKFKQCHGAA
jgi:preprotein translocase subunit SecA